MNSDNRLMKRSNFRRKLACLHLAANTEAEFVIQTEGMLQTVRDVAQTRLLKADNTGLRTKQPHRGHQKNGSPIYCLTPHLAERLSASALSKLVFEFVEVFQNFADDLFGGFLDVLIGGIFLQHKFCCRHIGIHSDNSTWHFLGVGNSPK